MKASAVAIATLVLLAACVSVRQGSQSRAAVTPTVETIRANIELTNLSSFSFPWLAWVAEGRLKRWDYEHGGPIPVKLNDVDPAESAVEAIEARLGKVIFDRAGIASTLDQLIARGIIVSEGTTVDADGMVTEAACGNVGEGPGRTAYPPDFYDETGRITTRLYVNLSSAKCAATLDIAIHEFGHALGMGKHFEGFGIGAVIDANFWNVLYNLYANEIGAAADDLVIRQLP